MPCVGVPGWGLLMWVLQLLAGCWLNWRGALDRGASHWGVGISSKGLLSQRSKLLWMKKLWIARKWF